MIELKSIIKQVQTLNSEITKLKVDNVKKENKLKDTKKISEENDKLSINKILFSRRDCQALKKTACIFGAISVTLSQNTGTK